MDNKILVIIILIIVLAVISTAFVTTVLLTNNDNFISSLGNTVDDTSTQSNVKKWHLVNSYSGVGDDIITINTNGNRIKLVSTAMPLKNYGDNFMITTVDNLGSSELSWNSKSSVSTKTGNIQFSGLGTHNIYVSAYELDYWNIEIYEWY